MEAAEIANQIHQIRQRQKEDEAALNSLRDEFMNFLDKMVAPVVHKHRFTREEFEAEEAAEQYIRNAFPDSDVEKIEYDEDGWIFTLRTRPRFTAAHFETDCLSIDRTISRKTPEVDLVLLEKLDPLMYRNVTKAKTVYELDEELLGMYLEEYPGAVATLQKALKGQAPTAVLRIKEKEQDEDSPSGS